MEISFFTSTRDKGISNYSERLIAAMKQEDASLGVHLVGLEKIFRINFNPIRYIQAKRLYTRLGKEMNKGVIAHIQHDYSLFCLWNNPFENMYTTFRKRIHIPVVITVHELVERNIKQGGSILTRIKYGLKRWYYVIFAHYIDYIERGMFAECDAVIVHTKQSRDKLIARGVSHDKIHIIVHGIPSVERSRFSVDEDKERFQVAGKFVITTFGLISERKGQDLLIDCMDKLPENVVYLIAGRPIQRKIFLEYYNNLIQKIKSQGLENRVIFTGFVQDEDVPSVMNATDIILAPSRDVTASGSISEAIAYGKPILATDLPFVEEINERIKCLETFEKDNRDDLKKKLLYLINDEQARIDLARKANEFAQEYSYLKAADQTISVYKSIISTI